MYLFVRSCNEIQTPSAPQQEQPCKSSVGACCAFFGVLLFGIACRCDANMGNGNIRIQILWVDGCLVGFWSVQGTMVHINLFSVCQWLLCGCWLQRSIQDELLLNAVCVAIRGIMGSTIDWQWPRPSRRTRRGTRRFIKLFSGHLTHH